MKVSTYIFILLGIFAVSCNETPDIQRLKYIDTRVGTAPSITKTAGKFGKKTEEFGQTIPAVLEPHGMNFWTPQTQDTEKKCIAPYYYRDTLLQGFRASHWIVGGCTQDFGSFTIMPLSEKLRLQPTERATSFSHKDETATPAYYAVRLPNEKILAEMTGRSRSAIFRFTFEKAGKGYLVVQPNNDEGEGYIRIDPQNNRIYGYNPVHRIYQGWGEAAGYSGHFVIETKRPITNYGVFHADSLLQGHTEMGGKINNERINKIGAYIEFDVENDEEVIIKAASSFVSMENAWMNLQNEIPHWSFEQTQKELTNIWEDRLALLQAESNEENALEKFYGALYRSSFLPQTFNDTNGEYPAFASANKIAKLPQGETYYDGFSMWDTYRAQHPLINLIIPKKGGQMMQSLVLKYQQGGWLPIFPCWNSYTAAMIGDHCLSAISDAYIKGIRNFDIETAYKAMRQNAFSTPIDEQDYKNGMGRRALTSYLKYGYIPLEDKVPDAFHTEEQVSRTLEYAYDDFCLSQIAKALGKDEDYKLLSARSQNYRHVINPRTGYAQGRFANGEFLQEENRFDFSRFITEGAPCHYTWYVPHDPQGLMECMGGQDAYVAKLDSMFSEGRYWHGNEPCHQIAFMFNYAGQAWKTQQAVRHIMNTEYLNAPGGLSGNDDAGQMSAWYLFAAMGFYPVCPGTPYYLIASPSFPKLTISPEGGKPFHIIAHGASKANIYIQSATLNGEPYTKNHLHHNDIVAGGILELQMGSRPNKEWGIVSYEIK